ncbi:hypothetical protein KSP40_PGU017677 [Platanthera guangdongensis]|uniref:Uncharacterized protein n=1 Tax=Platanthera guangdongensis TaxID=2320717 RepID=A0ABR2MTY6_9ASPA
MKMILHFACALLPPNHYIYRAFLMLPAKLYRRTPFGEEDDAATFGEEEDVIVFFEAEVMMSDNATRSLRFCSRGDDVQVERREPAVRGGGRRLRRRRRPGRTGASEVGIAKGTAFGGGKQ